jgi:hypothetical protein
MFIKKSLYVTSLMFLTLLFTGSVVLTLYADDSCIDCHKDNKFRVQNRVLFDYYNNWKNSIHDLSGVTCSDCHGGDPAQPTKEKAHNKSYSPLDHRDKESYRKIPYTCGKCHESIFNNFRQSKHYEALLIEGRGPQCATCHGSLNAEVFYTSIVARSCKECHNEYTGNLPEIAGEADKILHRINVSRAFRKWLAIYLTDKEREELKEINAQYKDITVSWHKFNFVQLDEKSLVLLNKLKALINKKLVEKKNKTEKK